MAGHSLRSPTPVRSKTKQKAEKKKKKRPEKKKKKEAAENAVDGMEMEGTEEQEEEEEEEENDAGQHAEELRKLQSEVESLRQATSSHSQAIVELQRDVTRTKLIIGPQGPSGLDRNRRKQEAERAAATAGTRIMGVEFYGKAEEALLEVTLGSPEGSKEVMQLLGKKTGMWCVSKQGAYVRLLEQALGAALHGFS